MRWSCVLLAAAVLVTAAGCSGDDDADAAGTTVIESTTTTNPPETTAPPPTAAPSTNPPTTVADTTTSTTSSTASTTTPTTTEPSEGATVVIAVIDAVDASWQASLEAVRDPFSEEKLELLDEHFTGVLLEGWRNTVADYRDRNYREIENASEPDAFEVELASVAVNEQGTFAIVQGCSITSGIIVEVGGNSDGSDRIVEDGIGRTVVELDLVNEDGLWKVEDARSPDESNRIASCA